MMHKILNKLSTNGKYIFLAYDHGLEHGPSDFDEKSINPSYVLNLAEKAGLSGIILQKGIAEKYYKGTVFQKKVPLLLKLNGKTNLFQGEPYAPQECSVSFAKRLGASLVGYTIYIGSKFESKMVQEFGQIVEEAHTQNIPVTAWIYPRGKSIDNETSPEMISYAARVGLELGADMVKIKYSGSEETFSQVVKAAGKVSVLMAGGPKLPEDEFLEIVKKVMRAGAAGVAVGRNVWQSSNPLDVISKLKNIVFG